MSRAAAAAGNAAKAAIRAAQAYRDRLPTIRVGAPRGASKVYFLTPDCDVPAGGVRVMYRHVDHLNAAGIDAAVLHSRRNFRCTWFEYDTPVTDTHRTVLAADDLLVVAEIDAGVLPSLPAGVRQVVFNQGPHLTFRRHPELVAPHMATSQDVEAILTASELGERLLGYAFPHLPVQRVHLGIDAARFRPADRPPTRVISYMPRRGRTDAELVLQMLRARGALDGWELRPLDGLSHAGTAAALQDSAMFLNFTYQEGFGLPAAEAMACGNYVIGFHGFGGEEFFRPAFSRAIPTGDVLAFAQAVEGVVALDERNPGWCRERGLAASEHVRRAYTLERERAEVVAFFAGLLGRDAPHAAVRAAA